MTHSTLKLSLPAVLLSSLTWLPSTASAISLESTIKDAIIHNPKFRQEVKAFRSVEAEVNGAKGGYRPVIDLKGGLGYEKVSRGTQGNEFNNELTRREASIKLTQNLFEGFGTQNEVARQQSRLDSASFKALSAANDIALSMATAYINLLREKDILKLSEDNLTTHTKILDQIVKRYNAGIGNQVEVDQAKARLALAQSNQGGAENNYYDAFATFQRVLGRQPDNALVKPKFTFKLPDTLEDATALAMKNHPTLRSANADVAAARAQFDSSKKGYYPSVNLEIEKTYDNNLAGIAGKNEYLQAMIRVKYNLYNGGKDSAARDRTAAEYHRASEIRNNTRRQVIENLRFAWNAQSYIGKQLEYINQHIKLTHKTLVGYRKQFNLGRRSLLDLLNTENEYVTASRSLINSDADELTAKYRILAGEGLLLETLKINYNFLAVKDDD